MRDKLLKTILLSSGLVAVVAAEGSTIVAGSELQDFIGEIFSHQSRIDYVEIF